MYEMLLTYDDIIDPEVLDDVMTLLSDTNWLVVTLDTVIRYSLNVNCIHYALVCSLHTVVLGVHFRESDFATVRPHRNQLCDWLGVPRPQVVAKVTICFKCLIGFL